MRKLLLLAAAILPMLGFAVDYRSQLANKTLIIEGANCAGFEFNSDASQVVWNAEIECTKGFSGSKWRVKWLDDKKFVTVETVRLEENYPPRNYIYEIVSMDKKTVKIINYWTGWNDLGDTAETYTIK